MPSWLAHKKFDFFKSYERDKRDWSPKKLIAYALNINTEILPIINTVFLRSVIFLLSLRFVIFFHSDDYISLFVPFFDIPVRLDDLFQRIESINDRFYLSRFNQFFE